MALPTPTLDDRRFQDLVDEAKRALQQRVPAWTDHNVHDPGVTLIELFAWMTDQLLYRLDRVPDRLHVRFLELIGVRLLPPSAARVAQTFWLSAAQDAPVLVPAGTEVATPRQGAEEPVVFSTETALTITPCTLATARSVLADGAEHPHTGALDGGQPFDAFATVPAPGDALLVGLSAETPSLAVALSFDCRVQGVGVDPRDPPLVWEAWTPKAAGGPWTACEIERDDTGGLNKPGDVVLHVPAGHQVSVVGGQRAAWLRARVLQAATDQPAYSSTPSVHALSAATVGGTVDALDGRPVSAEVLGTSDGVPGQVFELERTPVVAGTGLVLEVSAGPGHPGEDDGDDSSAHGWQTWTQVDDHGGSGPDDPHFVVDHIAGEVVLGPAVREVDGRLVRYGRVPATGAVLRLREYRTGGGARGNVARCTLTVVRSPVSLISTTINRRAARGGRDAETVDAARARGPLVLASRGRAVTAGDFESIALQSAREVARARAVPELDTAAGVRLLVVPVVGDDPSALAFGDLVPADETLQRVAAALDARRLLGTRLVVEPPSYQGVTVVARVSCAPLADPELVRRDCLAALAAHLHPTLGGASGQGWPFGRSVSVGEVYGVLQRVRGVDLVEDARLFPADPVSGDRGQATQRVEVAQHALVYGYDHQVRVAVAES